MRKWNYGTNIRLVMKIYKNGERKMSDMIVCTGCGKSIKATAKFCGFCGKKTGTIPTAAPVAPVAPATPVAGASVEKVCVKCGKVMPARAKFCGVCGGNVFNERAVVAPAKPVTPATPVTPVAPKAPKVTSTGSVHPDFKPAGDL